SEIGQSVVSPVNGKAYNFKGKYPGVEIFPSDDKLGIDKIRILYVDANPETKLLNSYEVTKGKTIIGTAADTSSFYNDKRIMPHIHIQVYKDGKLVDPEPYIFNLNGN